MKRGCAKNILKLFKPQGHMTKMLLCPFKAITFKNLYQNQTSDDYKTWHGASGAQGLQSFINDDPVSLMLLIWEMCLYQISNQNNYSSHTVKQTVSKDDKQTLNMRCR